MVYELAGITIGCFLFAYGTNAFLTPAELLAGGLGGVCVIFYHLFNWPIGVQYFVYNVPLLVLGYLHIGRKFIIYTIYSVIVSSIFYDVIPVKAFWTTDVLLCAIFGAVISGTGAAVILRLGGSVGGLDILSRVISKYFNVSVGQFGLLVSGTIIIMSAMLFDIEAALYTILSFVVGAKAYDVVLNVAEKRTVIIITNQDKAVSEAINEKLGRVPSSWPAFGAVSKAEQSILLIVILKGEWFEMLRLIKEKDRDSLVIGLPTEKLSGNFKINW